MRIRSIKPEFWTSDDVAALDWPTRLLFIGLWSYVDDNGVGRDNAKLVVADLFPLEEEPRDTLATVSRGLQTLCDGGQITRYAVDGKPYLYVNAWEDHQRIDRPNKPRYPLPTCENAVSRDTLATVSRHPREDSATGTGEQGNRGTGEQDSCASADAERESDRPSIEDEFDEWYEAYPRKRGRGQALKAYRTARRKVGADVLLASIRQQRGALVAKGAEFAPYPATWLNGERWADEPDSNVATEPRRLPYAHEIELPPDGLSPAEYAAWEREQRERRRA